MEHRLTDILSKTGINLSRFLLSFVFLTAGFLKAIDPYGTERQWTALMDLWGVEVSPLLLSVLPPLLSVCEFVLGVYLFFGIRRRITLCGMMCFIVGNLVFLAWLLGYGGEWQYSMGGYDKIRNEDSITVSFLLLVLAGVTMRYPSHIFRIISEKAQWMISLYTILFTIGLSVWCGYYQPLLGYAPYKEGSSLRSVRMTDGKGRCVTDSLLRQRKYTFLLVSADLRKADDSSMDLYDGLYDYCADHGYHLYGLTHKDSVAVSEWGYRTGAAYPFYYASEKELHALSRSNPTLLLLKDGRVLRKWSHWDFPDDEVLCGPLESLPEGKPDIIHKERRIGMVLLWLAVPLFVLTFFDRITALLLFGIRRWKRKKLIQSVKYSIIMRKKIVAGNWKMNKNLQEGIELAKELNTALTADKPNCGVIICTPFIHLASVAPLLDASIIGLGAENCADKEKGAYTGEVSAEMVKSTGAQYVILGHSERRGYYGETAEILKEKVQLALKNGLDVIFCIGEDLATREAGKQNEVVKAELEGSLFNLTSEEFSHIILAYEPIWAIGTGKTATPEQAEDMHAFIRKTIADKFGADAAENVTILYGGSCKPSNAKELFAKPDIDGGLIGGASLKAADFKAIIDAWK